MIQSYFPGFWHLLQAIRLPRTYQYIISDSPKIVKKEAGIVLLIGREKVKKIKKKKRRRERRGKRGQKRQKDLGARS